MNAEYDQDKLFKKHVILREQQNKGVHLILKLVITASYSIGKIYAEKLHLRNS